MSNIVAVLIGALIGAVPSTIAAIVAFRKLRSDNQNTDANTTKTIVEASGDVIEQLRAELTRQAVRQERNEAEIARLRLDFSALDSHVDDLEQIMRDAGLTPPPRPRSH